MYYSCMELDYVYLIISVCVGLRFMNGGWLSWLRLQTARNSYPTHKKGIHYFVYCVSSSHIDGSFNTCLFILGVFGLILILPLMWLTNRNTSYIKVFCICPSRRATGGDRTDDLSVMRHDSYRYHSWCLIRYPPAHWHHAAQEHVSRTLLSQLRTLVD
jgi:hypothetical protein